MSTPNHTDPATRGMYLAVLSVMVIAASPFYYSRLPSVVVIVVLLAAATCAGAGVGLMRREGRSRGR